MIFQNGYIQIKRKSGGGLDSDGFPIPVASSLACPIECQYRATTLNLGGKTATGEPQTRQSYTILIEEGSCICPLAGESVVLLDSGQNKVGEFEVLRIQPLDAVCKIKLYV